MIFKYTQIRRKINKFQAVEQNINFRQLNKIMYIKKQWRIFMQNPVYEYTT